MLFTPGPHFGKLSKRPRFFLLKSTWRSETLMAQLLISYDVVVAWQSHQAVTNQFLAEAHSQAGLSIDVLDTNRFVPGAFKLNLKRHLANDPNAVVLCPIVGPEIVTPLRRMYLTAVA